jgi:hypothetical protein
MNKVIEQCKDIILLNKKDIPEKIAIQAVHYTIAMAASLRRITLVGLDEQNVPLNYYGVTFANSGRGKDLSVSIAMKLVEDIINAYNHRLNDLVNENNARGLELIKPSVEHKEGTSSGLLQDRNVLDVLKIGSTNIRVEELVSTLRGSTFEDVVNTLTESWQEGKNASRSFKSYISPPVEFVPMNCLLYSSPEGFRDESNKNFQSFVNNLANGLSRRSYVVFDESDVQAESEPTEESLRAYMNDMEIARSKLKDMKEYIEDILMNGPRQIRMSVEAELECKVYEVKNKNIVAGSPLMKNAVKAELLNRSYKIRRLAGLYALLNGQDEVSIDDIRDAIEWNEMLNKDIVIALNAETIAEKIFDYLDKVEKYSSQTDIIKYYKMSALDFKNNIDEVYTVAYDSGSTLQSKVFDREAKVIKYNLIKGELTQSEEMICSASDQMSDGFIQQKIGYKQLPDLVRGKYGKNYSAGIFLNSKRNKDNYIRRQNLIIFDVDEGTTIDEAKLYLSQYRGFIATTRNHMKEKNGKVQERFRIVLISKYIFNLDHQEYTNTLTNFALLHNLTVDFPVIEPSRLYYSNPESEINFLDGDELVDLRSYIPETKEVRATEESIKHAEKTYSGSENINGLDKYFLMQTSQGNRNNNLVKYGFALIDKKGLSINEAKSKVLSLNDMLIDPLPISEIERTIFVSMERK